MKKEKPILPKGTKVRIKLPATVIRFEAGDYEVLLEGRRVWLRDIDIEKESDFDRFVKNDTAGVARGKIYIQGFKDGQEQRDDFWKNRIIKFSARIPKEVLAKILLLDFK